MFLFERENVDCKICRSGEVVEVDNSRRLGRRKTYVGGVKWQNKKAGLFRAQQELHHPAAASPVVSACHPTNQMRLQMTLCFETVPLLLLGSRRYGNSTYQVSTIQVKLRRGSPFDAPTPLGCYTCGRNTGPETRPLFELPLAPLILSTTLHLTPPPHCHTVPISKATIMMPIILLFMKGVGGAVNRCMRLWMVTQPPSSPSLCATAAETLHLAGCPPFPLLGDPSCLVLLLISS